MLELSLSFGWDSQELISQDWWVPTITGNCSNLRFEDKYE